MTALVDEFFGSGNAIKPTRVPPEFQVLLEKWLVAIERSEIGFLPRAVGDRLFWYAFSPTARDRRELLDLLDSWVGPTYSDLPQNRGDLDPSDPFDDTLAHHPVTPLRFEVLPRRKPGSTRSREQVRNALIVLSGLIADRPPSEFDAPRTTVEVLDDLGHALAAQDRDIAAACLAELNATADLDQANLTFLRLRTYAGMQDWNNLLADRDLEHVLAMRRPVGVTRVIQRAVYVTRLAVYDAADRLGDLLRAAEELPGDFRSITTGAPTTDRAEVVVEFLLAMLGSAPGDVFDRLLTEADLHEPGLAEHLRQLWALDHGGQEEPDTEASTDPSDGGTAPTESGDQASVESPAQRAMALMMSGEYDAALTLGLTLEPSVVTARVLLFCAFSLRTQEAAWAVADFLERQDLRGEIASADAVLRSHLAWLDGFLAPAARVGWRAWFHSLGRDQPGDATDPEVTAAWTPLDAAEFQALLGEATDEMLGRLGEMGGQFMAAHRELFVESGAAEISERVLAGLALASKNSAGARVQTLALLDYLAAANPNTQTVESALEWTGEIIAGNISALTASWAIDTLQAATVMPSTAAAEMQRFFYRVADLVRPYKSALDLTDLEAMRVVADEVGLDVPADLMLDRADVADPSAPYRHLTNVRVVLYSLTESAIIRAAQLLRTLVPGISVETTSEHDGSAMLASQASGADVFVIVTASAKHAATNFITRHRGNRPTILINSRGSSAILRALAEG
jgi:hypothetical protein